MIDSTDFKNTLLYNTRFRKSQAPREPGAWDFSRHVFNDFQLSFLPYVQWSSPSAVLLLPARNPYLLRIAERCNAFPESYRRFIQYNMLSIRKCLLPKLQTTKYENTSISFLKFHAILFLSKFGVE
jgi:hypothetical protein